MNRYVGHEEILAELQPVTLKNCTFKRFGSANDGGYLMCENLVQGIQSLYSYGIDTEDNWGCELSSQLKVPVHQYDCFTEARPKCEKGYFVFHDECVGPKPETIEGRQFDTLTNQIARNHDAVSRLIVKIDVEGAEGSVLLGMRRTLADAKPVLFVECSDAGRETAWNLLQDLGYRCQSAITRRWVNTFAEYRHSDFLWLPERLAGGSS